MRIESRLPVDRWLSGQLAAFDERDERLLLSPTRARGKSDSETAIAAKNPARLSTKRGGDHPAGTYHVVAVERNKQPAHSYGAAFLLLDPIGGDALVAKQNGRAGLGIHGGDLAADGSLRATHGCLRITNEAADALAGLAERELAAGFAIVYTCSEATAYIELPGREISSGPESVKGPPP